MPESFNVRLKEIRSLGIDIDLERIDAATEIRHDPPSPLTGASGHPSERASANWRRDLT